MKYIGSIQGIVAANFAPEEVQPEGGFLGTDIAALIQSRYTPSGAVGQFQFGAALIGNQGSPIPLPGGVMDVGGRSVAFKQLVLTPNALMAIGTTTEDADEIISYVMKLLDDERAFKFAESTIARQRASNIVVQFDRALGDYISKIKTIEGIYQKAFAASNPTAESQRIKAMNRISFGTGASPQAIPLNLPARTDFVIEVRVGTQPGQHRYFTSAPMATEKHKQLMEEIEQVLLKGK